MIIHKSIFRDSVNLDIRTMVAFTLMAYDGPEPEFGDLTWAAWAFDIWLDAWPCVP